MQHALDYRHNYGPHPAQNPLTTGQMLMIGAGALAVGGLAFWGFQAMKKKKQDQTAAAPNGNGTATNPRIAHHYYPRAA